MKDHRERTARLQLIEHMSAGHSWQTAAAQSQLKVSRSTAYRLLKLVRDEEKAERAFLDDRHGHPYKLTEPVRAWLVEVCTSNPQVPSSRVQSELKSHFGVAISVRETQPGAGEVGSEPPVAWSGAGARGKKLNEAQPVWQEGIGSFLRLSAAQHTGLLDRLVTAVRGLADPTIPGLGPPNPAVVERLVRTLLFLPVAGLARTWDLRGYTATMLARLSGRPRAYSQRYTERFLARLAHAGAAECLTEVMARWTWSLWQTEHPEARQPSAPAIYYIDGLSLAVYSDVLVPRGPVGRLDGKILGCRELVVLHDAQGHPLLAMTYRGDQHLTIGVPQMLHCYEQATGQVFVQWVVVDREGMAAEFLAQLQLEGRQVVTLLRSDQYEAEGSFEQVGQWQPWRYNRGGQLICEVASARFRWPRPNPLDPPVEVEVALIRDWRKLLPTEGPSETADDHDWKADLAPHQVQFWEEGWQAVPAPPAPTTPKLIPVITTGRGMQAIELAHTYFRRWNCQENAIRDWLIPLNLDTNHGYAKEQVVNSELAKRQLMLEGRVQRLERLAQASRGRLARLLEQDQRCREQAQVYEQRQIKLSAQVSQLEAAGHMQEQSYFPLKARQLAAGS
jgi:transposase